MSTHVSRKTYLAMTALCCLLAVALVLACTVYCVHTVEDGDHCDCPICRLLSVVGAIWVLTIALIVTFTATVRREHAEERTTHAETPVALFVKLNC